MNTAKVTFRPFFLAACSLLMGVLSLSAQDTGAIFGRISQFTNGANLEGVVISVEGTELQTVSGRGGLYSLSSIPAGSQKLSLSFIGLAPETRSVAISSGQPTELNIVMGDTTVDLETYVVQGQAFGQALALNIQRSSDNYRNVVSADAIGRFPDQNAAEAVNRLPGISIERDQGEGRFVVIRGIDPQLNAVAIDGIALASPSADSRATLLDTIPSDNLQSIEISKAPLPSEPGDAIGGYINIKTPSAYDYDGITARVLAQTDYSDLTSDWKGKMGATYGQQFGSEKQFGFLVSASYEERSFGSDNQEAAEWTEEEGEDGNDYWINDDTYEFREYDLTRTRIGFSGNFEFRPNNDNLFFLRTSFNEYEDTEVRQIAELMLGEEYEDAEGEDQNISSFGDIGPDSYVARDVPVSRAHKDRTETMTIFVASAGAEHTFGDWKLDYTGSYSLAEEDTPDDVEGIFALIRDDADNFTENPDFLISGTNTYNPRATFIAGSGTDPFDAANYEFDGVEKSVQNAEEKQWALQLNARRDLGWSEVSYIQFGGLYRDKNKVNELEVFESDDNPSEVDDLTGFVKTDARNAFGPNVPFVDRSFTGFYFENEDAFALERKVDDSVLEDYDSDEKVYAAYLMMGYGSRKANAIFGVRVEQTKYQTSGFTYEEYEDENTGEDVVEINSVNFEKDYTNWLPGVHFRYEMGKNTILRASVNKAIARPNFEAARPGILFEDDNAEKGNPALDPYRALNFDASVEHYLPSLGIVSVAAFHKKVSSFIYEQTLFDQVIGGRTVDELTEFRNGDSGSISGIEFAYQQQFTFLPGALDGLGFYANLTLTSSDATVLAQEFGDPDRELPFVKQSDMIGNLALTYEKSGFFFRIAATFRSEYLDEVGGDFDEDRYIDDHVQIDISSSYEIYEGFTIFANILNITDEPLKAFWGESYRLSQYEEYGWSANIGVRWQY